MELKEQPFAPTLAHKLGDVPHVSGLVKVAVERGANHYRRDFDPALPADLSARLGCESAVDGPGP